MSDIFISHATADQPLAEMVVDLLADAIGVPETSIFCSSVPGHGNPLTYDFNHNMLQQIQNPKLVVLLMTPAYMDSAFCLMELGATWALQLKPLPIVVPPVSFVEVTRTIGFRQGWNITDTSGLESIRQTVLDTLGIEGRGNHNFERKRKRWAVDLQLRLKELQPSPKVPRSEYNQVLEASTLAESRLNLRSKQVGELTAEIKKLQKRLSALRSKRPVVLIAEGEPLIALDLQQIIEDAGCILGGVVRTASELIEVAERVQPDIITTEISLADGSSGIDAVNEILTFHDVSAIVITRTPEALLKGPRPEPVFLVTKPFDPGTLMRVIEEAHGAVMRRRDARP
ncbi:TIR domain-containing protein [Neorhizobium galegae]|uniref:TIR domain-containing protein n=1 Tax=Neorhizobium galegae TaxID=399 RepID=UPI002105060D|nr:TIR domain-containing protein [Neorhizobium galegae]MCQ1855992.1 TIR domain-containing protein [Neorhizobium galegae]